jgi:PPOX class probable F420-dependent enzyme
MSMSNAEAPIPPEVLKLFDGKIQVGHMSTRRPDGHLSVVPVAVLLHEGTLKISSPTRTRKIRNLQHDPHIAICIDDPDRPLHYVMIRGLAELADDKDRAFVTWLARTYMGADQYPYEPPTVARTVITIRPERFVMPKVHGAD